MRHVLEAISHLCREHCIVTLCFVIASFVETATVDNAGLFLPNARQIGTANMNFVSSEIAFSGVVMQCLVLPLIYSFGLGPYGALFVGLAAAMCQMVTFATVTNITLLFALVPLGGFLTVPYVATLAIVSGAPSLDGEGPRDQGTVLGTLTSIKMLASCVGPLELGACNSNWEKFSAPFNVVGIGWWCLAALLAVGVMQQGLG